MGIVTQFIPRADTSGWTDAERDRLADLADRLSAKFGQVHATYGTSDQGEPWCVITDEDDEVIVHVARINGQFVIHEAGDDILRVGETLWSACDRLLGDDWRDSREDVVVSLNRRQAHSVLAIAVLADFVYEVYDAGAAERLETAPPAKAAQPAPAILSVAPAAIALTVAHETPPPPPEASEHSQLLVLEPMAEAPQSGGKLEGDDRLQPTEGDVEDVPPPTLATTSSEGEAPAAAGRVLVGGDGDDVLQGGDGDDVLIGGRGDDTAIGGDADDTLTGGEDNDVLLGQAGDDVAYGNGGADTVDGGDGDDWVRGGQGDDSIGGGHGDDFISGDKGSDTLSGGPGADLFNFFMGGGRDVVADFDRRQGDQVVIEDHATYTVTQEGDDTVIALNAADRVVLLNTQVTTLSEGWIAG